MASFRWLFALSLSFLSLPSQTKSQADQWTTYIGTWVDIGDSWTGDIPVGDDVWHYGPARIWNIPVDSDNYVITSRIRAVGGTGCGHTFKYKQGSESTRSLVTMAWGFFVGGNHLSISQSGIEYDPRISYPLTPDIFHNLKSVVNGTNVKIYINDNLAQEITMQGTGADSKTDNYVGLWCHARQKIEGDSFSVEGSSQCPSLDDVDPLVYVSPNDCLMSAQETDANCSFSCPPGYLINGSSYMECGSDGEWSSDHSLISCLDINECAEPDNGGCSHKCINTEGSYKCTCPDPELSLSLDNKTCHAPDVDVQCTQNNMTISIPKSILRGIDGSHLHLLDTTCNATETNKTFYLVTPLTGCGTTKEIKNGSGTFVYSNKVLSTQTTSLVTRARAIEVPFSCIYSRYGIVSSLGLKTQNTKLVFDKEGRGIFTMSMNMFPDSNFVTPYSNADFPIIVLVPDPVFFEVSVTSIDEELSVRAMECYATPTENPEDSVQYDIINDGCSVEQTVVDYPAPAVSVQRFSIDSFQFVGDREEHYAFFHCQLMVCNASDPDSQCAKPCPLSVRGKRNIRDYLDTTYRLVQGPFQLVFEEDGELEDNVNDEEEDPNDKTVAKGSTPSVSLALSLIYVMFLAGTALEPF